MLKHNNFHHFDWSRTRPTGNCSGGRLNQTGRLPVAQRASTALPIVIVITVILTNIHILFTLSHLQGYTTWELGSELSIRQQTRPGHMYISHYDPDAHTATELLRTVIEDVLFHHAYSDESTCTFGDSIALPSHTVQ